MEFFMKRLFQVIYLGATISVPILLVLFAVGILLSPIYIQIEYRIPGFPDDPYGFSMEERLYWANISRKYLVSNQGIDFLADQQLDEDTPLYNERELQHMYDVKVVIVSASVVFCCTAIFVILLGFWSKNKDQWRLFKLSVSRGGWLTAGLIISILIYIMFNFDSLFTNFHLIFFEGDSWLFRFSDTLIRLFPIRFWRDAFIWVGVMCLVAGFGLGYFINTHQSLRQTIDRK
jgi:integral membrane protein (TIGR01906 family)